MTQPDWITDEVADKLWSTRELEFNKTVLLRERKRHTTRRVAVARAWYSGGGVPLQKKFFPV